MGKVILMCRLPNASNHINGIEFASVDGGVVAEVDADIAKSFLNIPGYEIAKAIPEPAEGKSVKPPANTGDQDPSNEELTLAEVQDALKADPDRWAELLAAESARDKPRKGVLAAIETAKQTLEGE